MDDLFCIVCIRIILLTGVFMYINASAQVNYPKAADGLQITAQDTSSLVNISFRIQSQASYSANNNGTDMSLNGMIRRMRLKFDGFVLDPRFAYKLELALSNRDMGNRRDEVQVGNSPKLVLDAVLKYNFAKNHALWFGQTKLPGNRERVISSQSLQFVDRSQVNGRFNIDRDFGIWYWYKGKVSEVPYTFTFALTSGEGRNITIANSGGLSYTGRLEVYPFGKFTDKGDYFGADLRKELKPKLALGTSYCFNDRTDRSAGQLGSFVTDSGGRVFNTLSTAFIDLMFKYRGWSVMAEYANRIQGKDLEGFTAGEGYVIQSGYMIGKHYELAMRYTHVRLESLAETKMDYTEYTLGVSNYILDHTLKWQCDFGLIENFDVFSHRIRFQVEIGI